MIENRYFGHIFLPETPKQKIEGVWLNINNNSIYLETSYNSLFDQKWELIQGVFNGLGDVTLVDTLAGAGSSGKGGTWRKITVSYMLKGIHVNNVADLCFSKITLFSPTLTRWITEPGRINQVDYFNYEIPLNKTIFSVTLDEIKISLLVTHQHELSASSLDVKKLAIFIIESVSELHISDISEKIRRIKKWILFVTNKNPEFSEYYVSSETNKGIEVVNTLDNLNESKFTQSLSLQYYIAKSCLQKMFENWMKNEKLIPIIDLILDRNYNTSMSSQSYFLNVCVGIEHFHDEFRHNPNKDLINERKKNKAEISNLIKDDALRKWFRKTTQYWDRADLRDRLNSFRLPISKIIGDTFSFTVDELIDKILKTRNSMAHDGSYSKHFTYIELFLVSSVLELTLKCEILNLLEYSTEIEHDVLLESKNHIRSLARINEYFK